MLELAVAGTDYDDFKTAAAMLDRAFASLCPHTREAWQTGADPATGRPLTTCYRCNVSWFADYEERPAAADLAR